MSLMKEYIERGQGAKDLEEELLKLIGEYNKIRKTYLIIYAGAIGKPIPDIYLNIDDYYIIYDLIRGVDSKQIDFYVESPGGDGAAAEELVRFLRKKFDNIDFVVSGTAKSAGTLLVLSGNNILMTESGSLGPIDAQLGIGRSIFSAYDYMDWVNSKREEAEKMGKLNPFDATMVAQISPGELKLVYHALEFAKDLVIEWLSKHKFKSWTITQTRKIPVTDKMKHDRAAQIASELANHARWRTHGRSIKIDDLESLGLQITKIDDDPKLADIVYRIQTVIRLLFSSTTTYKIFATEKEKIFKQATPMVADPKIPSVSADVVELETKCQKCGKTHKLYGKFIDNPQIDKDFRAKGAKQFPKDNRLICDCGFEINLNGPRNDIESRIGKKMIFTDFNNKKEE